MTKHTALAVALAANLAISGFSLAQTGAGAGSGGTGGTNSQSGATGTRNDQRAPGGAAAQGGTSGTGMDRTNTGDTGTGVGADRTRTGQGQTGQGGSGARMGGTNATGTTGTGPGNATGVTGATGSTDSGMAGSTATGTGMTGSAAGMNAGSGQQSDQSMVSTIQKIGQTPEQAGDKLFVLGAATGNLWETQYGQLVAQRAQDEKVKELARDVARDHQANNEKLRPIAQKMQIDMPQQLSSEKQAKLAVLATLPPEQLEKAYLADMRAGHAKDITCFSDAREMVKDDQLKSYISETLPKLREHGSHIVSVSATKGMSGQVGMGSDLKNTTEGARNLGTHGNDPGARPGGQPIQPGNQSVDVKD